MRIKKQSIFTLILAACILLVTLWSCASQAGGHITEGVLVYQHGGTWYLYTGEAGDRLYTLSDRAPVENGPLEAGQKVRVHHDGMVLEISPPRFNEVLSIEALGAASGEDFQAALDYFNTEVKPWHLPEDAQ